MPTPPAQNRVFVLDANQKPLMPCHPARARQLLKQQKAAVFRCFPFTIILKHRTGGVRQPVAQKADPGARTTGLVLVATFKRGKRCIWAGELNHRGHQVKQAIQKRKTIRRSRRSRKTRYRQPRFLNRTRPKGWLPPSLKSRVDNIASWTSRLRRYVPISQLAMELTRFDTQKLQHPEISGVEYQQGTLFGYELREYLLEKWGRGCVYCKAQGVPLQVEHMTPKSRGGSDRVSNLTLACGKCNLKKGTQTAAEFGFGQLQAKGQQSLRAAAYMNATRYAILEVLKKTGLPVECGTGGRTKYNRAVQGYPKAHWLDAMCVGESGEKVFVEERHQVLQIKARGRGKRQKCNVDRYGFPRGKAKRHKRVRGFGSGDLVEAKVPKGKKKGRYVGRVLVRQSGSFDLQTSASRVSGLSHKYCKLIQRNDGYSYG